MMSLLNNSEVNGTKINQLNFVHVGDTHLSASNFKLKEREDDFLFAFKQVIDYCVDKKPDFMIHSGDLFDRGKPSNKILLFAIKQLKRLRKAGIPIYVVPGSHDMSVDGTFITILERVGLLVNVANPKRFSQEEEAVLMKGVENNKAVIYGVPGRRANIKAIYESLKTNPSDKFKIFIFHHIITNVKDSESFADIPLSSLPRGMDYYAGGHWHEHEEFDYEGKPVIYPGSTEYSDIDSMERESPRGFIHYNGKPEFIKLSTREVSIRRVDCNGLTPEEVTNKCVKNLVESKNGLMVLRLEGTLKSGRRNEVDVDLIKSKATDKGCLHCNVKISGLINPGESISYQDKSVDEIESEFLKKKGYSESDVILAKQLINLLGINQSNDDLIKALKKVEVLL